MARLIPLTTVLVATLAGAASALAQPLWVEGRAIPDDARGGDQERRIEIRAHVVDDDRAEPRRRVEREQRVIRGGEGRGGEPRIMFFNEDGPREVRKPGKRKVIKELRRGPDGRGGEKVEIRIDGPDGPMQFRGGDRLQLRGEALRERAGQRGREEREVIILRDDDHDDAGRGEPRTHRFEFPGGDGRVMIFKHGPDGHGAGGWAPGEGGPKAFEFRGGPDVKVRAPRGAGGPQIKKFKFDGGEGQIMILDDDDHEAGPRGDVLFRKLPGGPGEQRDVIIRRPGVEMSPSRIELRRTGGQGSGQCPNCNCI